MDVLQRDDLESRAAELMDRQFARVPNLREFHEGTWTDREFYTRHMIEAVLRIRMCNVADAYALYKASYGDHRLAGSLATYLAEEIGHEGMFVRDLERLGVSLAEIDSTTPFPATAKVMGYIKLQTDLRGPAPAALWDWYLEWYSDRYISAITEAASREFGSDTTTGASGHLDVDDDQGHDELMFKTTARAVELYGSAESAYADLELYFDLSGEYYEQLYTATVGSRLAAGLAHH